MFPIFFFQVIFTVGIDCKTIDQHFSSKLNLVDEVSKIYLEKFYIEKEIKVLTDGHLKEKNNLQTVFAFLSKFDRNNQSPIETNRKFFDVRHNICHKFASVYIFPLRL